VVAGKKDQYKIGKRSNNLHPITFSIPSSASGCATGIDFPSAEKERERLLSQLAGGQITRDAYVAAINGIRVTDAQGRWWQPDPSGKGWLSWNGSAWVPGTPPGLPGAGGLQPGTAKTFVEFKNQLMTEC
jgi:hypothetical protein